MPLANAARIFNGALRFTTTHPTGLTRLKCCNKIFLWDGLLARPVRAGCPHHKSHILCTILAVSVHYLLLTNTILTKTYLSFPGCAQMFARDHHF
jgi:hypothetical protein